MKVGNNVEYGGAPSLETSGNRKMITLKGNV